MGLRSARPSFLGCGPSSPLASLAVEPGKEERDGECLLPFLPCPTASELGEPERDCSTMSYERRGNRLYFYRGYREGRRLVRFYAGGGSQGEQAATEHAEMIAARRAARESARKDRGEARAESNRLETRILTYHKQIETLFRKAMNEAGLVWHNYEWRLVMRKPKPSTSEFFSSLKEEQARRLLLEDKTGDAARSLGGDLHEEVIAALLKRVADPSQRAAIRHEAQRVGSSLDRPGQTVIEMLLIQRIVLHWMSMHIFDIQSIKSLDALQYGAIQECDFLDRRRMRSEKLYQLSLKNLDLLRARAIQLKATVDQIEQKAQVKKAKSRRSTPPALTLTGT